MMKFDNPRYQVFYDIFGQQPTYVYITFISRMRKMFSKEYGGMFNHEAFTDFIKVSANKVKLNEII